LPAVQAANANQQRALTEMKDAPPSEVRAPAPANTEPNLLLPASAGFLQLGVRPVAPANNTSWRLALRRFGVPNAPEWTGESAVRNPELFPLKTVDALVAGKSLWVFD